MYDKFTGSQAEEHTAAHSSNTTYDVCSMWRLKWISYLLIWNGSSIQRHDVGLSVFIYLLDEKLQERKWLLKGEFGKDDYWQLRIMN